MTTAHPRLNVAVVGAGAMGSLHARVISQSNDADLSVVIDPDGRAAEALGTRHQARWAMDLDSMAGIDAIVVATPTVSHLEWGTRALDAGIPVLIEKPLGATLDETRTLIDLASRRGVPLMCGLLERYNAAVRTAVGIAQSPVHITSVRHSPYASRIATGVASDLLIHDIDLVLRIAQQPLRDVSAAFSYCHPESKPECEDVAEVVLAFEDPLVASLSVSRVSQRKVRTLVISELDRLIEVDMVRQDITVYKHVTNAPVDVDGPGYRQQTIIDIPTILDAREPLAVQLERFVKLARCEIPAAEELETLLAPHAMIDEITRIATTSTTIPNPPKK